jgi:hypothetical protein
MATQGIKTYITGLTGFLIVRYAEVATPSAYIGQTTALAFPVDHTYTIINLRRVAHYFEFWQSNDGTTLSQQIKVWEIDVAKQEVPAISIYYYRVNGGRGVDGVWSDPLSDQLQLRDTRLAGKQYTVDEEGTGPLTPVEEYTDFSGGGFDKISGFPFQDGGRYRVTVYDKIVVDTPEPSVTSGGGFSAVMIANEANHVLTADYYGKLIECGYATGGTGIFTLQALATIPDGTVLRFSTHLGNQQYLKIQLSGSETVKFWGKNRNHIYLGKCESLDILKQNGQFYCMNDNTGYDRVGQRVWGDVVEINTYLRNGNDYAEAYAGRLIDWALDNFASGQLVSFATWNTSVLGVPLFRRLFAYDSASNTIRVPDSMNMYQRAVPTTGTTPGAYQPDTVGPVTIELMNGQGGSGTGPISNTQGFSGQDSNAGYIDGSELVKLGVGTETRGKGELLLPLVRI